MAERAGLDRNEGSDCREVQTSGGSDGLQRLDEITSGDVTAPGRAEQCESICDGLECLIEEVRTADKLRTLRQEAARSQPRLVPVIDRLMKQKSGFLADLCSLVYLLKRLEAAPEMCPAWLEDRVRQLVTVGRELEKNEASLIASNVTWRSQAGSRVPHRVAM
jgi:hypothetical protein